MRRGERDDNSIVRSHRRATSHDGGKNWPGASWVFEEQFAQEEQTQDQEPTRLRVKVDEARKKLVKLQGEQRNVSTPKWGPPSELQAPEARARFLLGGEAKITYCALDMAKQFCR